MPRLHSEDEELLLKLPTNFQEAQAVKATLALYKENCSGLVIALLICLYLFMQVQLTSYLLDGIHSLSVPEQYVINAHIVRSCRHLTSCIHLRVLFMMIITISSLQVLLLQHVYTIPYILLLVVVAVLENKQCLCGCRCS